MNAKSQFFVLSVAFTLLHAFSSVAATESLGNLAQYPPERIVVTITTADNGAPQLQPDELVLALGSITASPLIALMCGTTSRAGASKCQSF